MDTNIFWSILIIALLVGITIGITYTNLVMTGRVVSQINPFFEIERKNITTNETRKILIERIDKISIQQPVTYEGILQMLNSCKISTTTISNFSCNQQCAYNNFSICTAAYLVDSIQKLTIPYECNKLLGNNMNGSRVLHCVCCSPIVIEEMIIKAFREGGNIVKPMEIICEGNCCWGQRVVCCWDEGGCRQGCCHKIS